MDDCDQKLRDPRTVPRAIMVASALTMTDCVRVRVTAIEDFERKDQKDWVRQITEVFSDRTLGRAERAGTLSGGTRHNDPKRHGITRPIFVSSFSRRSKGVRPLSSLRVDSS